MIAILPADTLKTVGRTTALGRAVGIEQWPTRVASISCNTHTYRWSSWADLLQLTRARGIVLGHAW